MIIDDILKTETTDPGIWNSVPQLGWKALLTVEAEYRASWTEHPTKAQFRVYQKLRRAQQHTAEYKEFRKYILEQYGYCCKCYGEKELQVHHRKSWFRHPELRMDPKNVEVQCAACHRKEDSSKWFRAQTRARRSPGKRAERPQAPRVHGGGEQP